MKAKKKSRSNRVASDDGLGCRHLWRVYFCNKTSTEHNILDGMREIRDGDVEDFSVCHKCGEVCYRYCGKIIIAKPNELSSPAAEGSPRAARC